LAESAKNPKNEDDLVVLGVTNRVALPHQSSSSSSARLPPPGVFGSKPGSSAKRRKSLDVKDSDDEESDWGEEGEDQVRVREKESHKTVFVRGM
jgi:hypothetical protein